MTHNQQLAIMKTENNNQNSDKLRSTISNVVNNLNSRPIELRVFSSFDLNKKTQASTSEISHEN